MSLPKQIQQQLEEADRIEQELQAPPAEPEQPETPETPAPAEPAPAEPPAQPEQTPPPPEAPAQETPKSEEDVWQRRYQTLQGKFNAEVPRLNAQVKELNDKLNDALTRLTKTETPPAQPAKSLVTDQDVEVFGDDLIDLIRRQATEVARTEAGSKVADLEAENQKLREQVTGVSERQGENDRRTYFVELAQLVPDYEALNVDEGFLGWLAEADPLSGLPRQEYLNNAFTSFDPQRTALLFNTYKQLTAPAPKPSNAKNLQRQVAPNTSKVSPVTTDNPETRIWSLSEVEQFYKDVSLGKYKGRDDERAKTEADIDLAVASNRVAS